MAKRYINWILAFALLGSILNFAPAYAFHSDNFTFFVPYPADSLQAQFEAMQAELNPDYEPAEIVTTISISVLRSGTTVYYDQWEDGLEQNIYFPTQPTTVVSAPLAAGEVYALRSTLLLPRDPADQCVSFINTTPTDLCFDGGDKIVAVGGSIAVTYAAWPEPIQDRAAPGSPPIVYNGFGVLFAGAWELYPTGLWEEEYVIPIGENLGRADSNLRGGFTDVGITVQAIDEGTLVSIDLDADGTFDIVDEVLNEGESWPRPGDPAAHVTSAGARVMADMPVQVHIIAGDPARTWEARAYTMLPRGLWTHDYLAPRTSDGDYWLYNPNSSSMDVDVAWVGGGAATVTIPPGGVTRYTPPPPPPTTPLPPAWAFGAQSGVSFTSQDGASEFYGLAALDADENQDWGYALLPTDFLSTQALVGWAPGNDDTPPSGDESRLYVTAAQDVDISVDYNADGIADDIVSVPALDEVPIVDPDHDLTGTFLYSSSGPEPFIAVWGQDWSAPDDLPSIDVGTNIAPLQSPSIQKFVTLIEQGYNCGTVQQRHWVEFEIGVYNDSDFPLDPAVIRDVLGSGITYLEGTTFLNGTQPVEDGPGGTFPLGGDGYTLPGGLDRFSEATITFQALVVLEGMVSNLAEFVTPSDIEPAVIELELPLRETTYQVTKTLVDPPSGPVDPGDSVTFDVTILNTGNQDITQLSLRDEFDPDFLTFDSASIAPSSVDTANGVITWADLISGGNSLAPGAVLPLTLNFTANSPLPSGAASTLNVILAEGVEDSDGIPQAIVCDEAQVSFRVPTPTPTLTPTPDDGNGNGNGNGEDPTPTPTRPTSLSTPPPTPPPAPTPSVLLLPETGVGHSKTAPMWPLALLPGLGLLMGWVVYRRRRDK